MLSLLQLIFKCQIRKLCIFYPFINNERFAGNEECLMPMFNSGTQEDDQVNLMSEILSPKNWSTDKTYETNDTSKQYLVAEYCCSFHKSKKQFPLMEPLKEENKNSSKNKNRFYDKRRNSLCRFISNDASDTNDEVLESENESDDPLAMFRCNYEDLLRISCSFCGYEGCAGSVIRKHKKAIEQSKNILGPILNDLPRILLLLFISIKLFS